MKNKSDSKGFAQASFDQYRDHLHRYLVRRLRRSHLDVDDALQETYLRLLRVDDTSLIRKPQAYLFRMASNVVRELELKEQNTPLAMEDESVDPETIPASPASGTDRVEHASSLDAMLRRLPPVQQAVLVLMKRDGKSYREIAEELGLSLNTVKKYLFLAVSHCRQHGWK